MYKFTYPLIKSKIKTWLKYYIAKMGQKAKYILSEIVNLVPPITLENTAPEQPFNKFEIQGNTFQQTYTGKNLVNIPDGTANATISIPIDIPLNTYLSASAYLSRSDGNNCAIRIDYKDIDNVQQYILPTDVVVTGISKINNFIIPEGATDIKLTIQFRTTVAGTITYSNVQIEKGSSATDYEPYVGGIPNPSYPQNIEVVKGTNTVKISNKNLFSKENFLVKSGGVSVTYDSNDNPILEVSSAGSRFALWEIGNIEDFRGKTLTFSIKENPSNLYKNCCFMNCDSSGGNRNSIGTAIGENSTSTTYTVSEMYTQNILVVRLYVIGEANTNYTFEDVQVEINDTPTTYVQHAEQSFTLSLGSLELCKIGDYKDYIYRSEDKWYKHAEVGKVVLDGSESWNTTEYTNLFRYSIDDYLMPQAFSNYFTNKPEGCNDNTSANALLSIGEFTFRKGTKDRLYLKLNATTTTELKTWLSTHNTIVYYVLATPTDTQITDTTLIEQLEALEEAYTYEDQTNISWTGDLAAYLKLQYYIKEDTNNE